MPQATQRTEPGTGLIPAPRTAPDGAPAGPRRHPAAPADGWGRALLRGVSVARGLRSLRPVAARPQPGYGEVDGQ
ncbi:MULTISPECIES: hypothetical protein [Kitasatospora]|uniref:Uncharacterized protein n=1 Tax=Kitasatospora setae (strain ATCC 33774 / DSM 43861 / JCM 3304 / KCC A-0304 / NBRC 14216 / KM-6054) TaxID=452652 RepID=E4MZY4_KITSK|nr:MULTISPECIES: hypothetical protein [Kitasatospora]BAJ30068.1 hypothetical protein KSE_42830 [Kitasatospora setae KM-6054]